MTRPIRRFIFYTLLIVFIFASAGVGVYSLGYTIDFRQRILEHTGGIFIKSRIPRLSLFLDDTRMQETALLSGNAFLTSVPVGTHVIRLEKEGYQPWSKKIRVEAGVVNEYRSIILLPKELIFSPATPEQIEAINQASTRDLRQDFSEEIQALRASLSLSKKHDLTSSNGTTTRLLASNVHSFNIIDPRTILFINRNGFLARLALPEKNIETISHPGFFLSEKSVRFISSPRDSNVALIDASGGLFLLDESRALHTITGGVRDSMFDADAEKLLIVKEHSIEVLWHIDNPRQPFQKKGMREIVFESREKIRDAAWLYHDNFHIIARTAAGLFFIELDGRDGRNIVPISTEHIDASVTLLDFPTKVFLKKGAAWFAIDLL